jgi:hypothetical protein
MDRAIAAQLMESAGFGGMAEVRFARDPAQATLVDGMGNPQQPLPLNGDAIPVEYSAGEVLRVRVEWT